MTTDCGSYCAPAAAAQASISGIFSHVQQPNFLTTPPARLALHPPTPSRQQSVIAILITWLITPWFVCFLWCLNRSALSVHKRLPSTATLDKQLWKKFNNILIFCFLKKRQKWSSISTIRCLLPAWIYHISVFEIWNTLPLVFFFFIIIKMTIELLLTSLPIGRLEFWNKAPRCLPFVFPHFFSITWVGWSWF